jgi:chorismate mutase
VRPRTAPRPRRLRSHLALLTAAGVLLGGLAAAPARADAPGTGGRDAWADVVRLSAARLALADQVAAAKWAAGQPVDDPSRERRVLAAAAAGARRLGARPDRVVGVMGDEIEAAKVIERTLIAGWRADPRHAPGAHTGTARIRARLDRLDDLLVRALAATAPPAAGTRCAQRLTARFAHAAARSRPDALHAAALAVALGHVCG